MIDGAGAASLQEVFSVGNLDLMLKRNKEYAAQQSEPGALMPQSLPHVKAVIIGCADMRVDPAHVLGIKQIGRASCRERV